MLPWPYEGCLFTPPDTREDLDPPPHTEEGGSVTSSLLRTLKTPTQWFSGIPETNRERESPIWGDLGTRLYTPQVVGTSTVYLFSIVIYLYHLLRSGVGNSVASTVTHSRQGRVGRTWCLKTCFMYRKKQTNKIWWCKTPRNNVPSSMDLVRSSRQILLLYCRPRLHNSPLSPHLW